MTNKAAQSLGKLGGLATKTKYGNDYFKRIAKGWPKGKKRGAKNNTINFVSFKITEVLKKIK